MRTGFRWLLSNLAQRKQPFHGRLLYWDDVSSLKWHVTSASIINSNWRTCNTCELKSIVTEFEMIFRFVPHPLEYHKLEVKFELRTDGIGNNSLGTIVGNILEQLSTTMRLEQFSWNNLFGIRTRVSLNMLTDSHLNFRLNSWYSNCWRDTDSPLTYRLRSYPFDSLGTRGFRKG